MIRSGILIGIAMDFFGLWYVRTGDNLFVDISKLQLGGDDVEIFPCLHFQRVLQEHICKRVRSSR